MPNREPRGLESLLGACPETKVSGIERASGRKIRTKLNSISFFSASPSSCLHLCCCPAWPQGEAFFSTHSPIYSDFFLPTHLSCVALPTVALWNDHTPHALFSNCVQVLQKPCILLLFHFGTPISKFKPKWHEFCAGLVLLRFVGEPLLWWECWHTSEYAPLPQRVGGV